MRERLWVLPLDWLLLQRVLLLYLLQQSQTKLLHQLLHHFLLQILHQLLLQSPTPRTSELL